MDALIASLALFLAIAAVVCALGIAARSRARPQLQIWQVLRRFGIAPGGEADTLEPLARAVRRCALCRNVERCERWLASPSAAGLDHFCPNAATFALLRRGGAKQP